LVVQSLVPFVMLTAETLYWLLGPKTFPYPTAGPFGPTTPRESKVVIQFTAPVCRSMEKSRPRRSWK
jgi:hypothetical protein